MDKVPSLLTDIFTAYYCARKNKRNTRAQISFERNLSENLIKLYEDIRSGAYRVGRSICFVVRDPVLREVFAASFRDRIVHHLLYNWLMPIFEPTFIYDSYSCRQSKGTLFGIKRLGHHIRSCSNNYRKECHVLRLDIEGYFMTINRHILYEMIVSRLKKQVSMQPLSFDLNIALDLLYKIIFNDPTKGCYRKGSIKDWEDLPQRKSLFYAPEGCGLPIGNLTSQLFSNIYLSALDEYIKRNLHCKHYGRYVDDFFLVGNSREELLQLIPKIREMLLSKLGLVLHPRKISLTSISQGVTFLGTVHRPYRYSVTSKLHARIRHKTSMSIVQEANPYRLKAILKSYEAHLSMQKTRITRFSIGKW